MDIETIGNVIAGVLAVLAIAKGVLWMTRKELAKLFAGTSYLSAEKEQAILDILDRIYQGIDAVDGDAADPADEPTVPARPSARPPHA